MASLAFNNISSSIPLAKFSHSSSPMLPQSCNVYSLCVTESVLLELTKNHDEPRERQAVLLGTPDIPSGLGSDPSFRSFPTPPERTTLERN